MSGELHAEHRRRLYLAMLDHPDGITAEDFAHTPAIDGGEWIPRVAPRIHELRAEHPIPLGLRRGAFALYRLQAADHTPRHGFTPVVLCHRCLSTFPAGHACPAGGRLENLQSGTGPMAATCRRAHIDVEVPRAA